MSRHEQPDPMERRLWERTRRPRPAKSGPCPDPLLLAAYLDGTAAEAEVRQVEEHMASCPACLAAVGQVRGLLAAPPMIAPRRTLDRAKALAPATAAAAAASRWSAVARWAAAATAAAVVGYLGFTAGHTTSLSRTALADTLVCETSFGLADESCQAFPEDDFLMALKEAEQ
jgi:predicted anti-sigma-YlaC factor YlaD